MKAFSEARNFEQVRTQAMEYQDDMLARSQVQRFGQFDLIPSL